MSGLTTRLKSTPPSLLGSVINGRKGVPPGRRITPETTHLPISVSTTLGTSPRNCRLRPSGRSQMKVELKLFAMSKVDIERSELRGAPKDTCPRAWPVDNTLVSGLASDA